MPSIYQTPDGAVFKTPDGKLVKQPYDCGNALQNRMALNNYIEVTGLAIEAGYSIIGICNAVGTAGTYGFLQLISSSLNLADSVLLGSGSTVAGFIDNITYTSISTTDAASKVFCYVLKNNSGIDKGNNLAYISNNINTTTRNVMRIGACGNLTNAPTVGYYLHPLSKINRLIILNRSISIDEYRYYRNNLLFNELQSSMGVLHTYHLGTAEVINMAGTDTACIRDTVGGVHGKIINLPAGTAQQKVNYYNTNLSVPFQS